MVIDMSEEKINTVEFAKALADDTRQKIMSLCCCKQLSVGDIVDALEVAQPTVSHHLKILKNAGLVTAQRQGKEILYTLNQRRLASACCVVAVQFAPDHPVEVIK
jgi:ArsR family transcriptional regulator